MDHEISALREINKKLFRSAKAWDKFQEHVSSCPECQVSKLRICPEAWCMFFMARSEHGDVKQIIKTHPGVLQ